MQSTIWLLRETEWVVAPGFSGPNETLLYWPHCNSWNSMIHVSNIIWQPTLCQELCKIQEILHWIRRICSLASQLLHVSQHSIRCTSISGGKSVYALYRAMKQFIRSETLFNIVATASRNYEVKGDNSWKAWHKICGNSYQKRGFH